MYGCSVLRPTMQRHVAACDRMAMLPVGLIQPMSIYGVYGQGLSCLHSYSVVAFALLALIMRGAGPLCETHLGMPAAPF